MPGIIKESSWQLYFTYLHAIIALSKRHTDVFIHGFIEISPNTKVYHKNIILYFKKFKTKDKQLSKFKNFHSSIWMHNINFSHIFNLNTMHT